MKLKRAAALTAVVVLLLCLITACGSNSVKLPVLMYHHLDEVAGADTVVTPEAFEAQIKALADAGYTSVLSSDIIDYVENGSELPKNPVMITFDDGYTSNLTLAAPILEKYGMSATVFVIGMNVGQTVYKHSGEELLPPRFSWEEAQPWVEKGVIDIQSHTYDMHQRESYGYSGREGVLQMDGEADESYRKAFLDDMELSAKGIEEGLGTKLTSLAYPFGFNSKESEALLTELGIKVSLTTKGGMNYLKEGDSSSLRLLNRIGVTDSLSGAALVEKLKSK